MSYDPQNIFARILRGELPCHKVYEDEDTLAFMDLFPQDVGHFLVIPKTPAVTLMELPEDAACKLILVTRKLAIAAQKALKVPGVMLMQLNGTEAGQSVPHVHFHVIPRVSGGLGSLGSHGRNAVSKEELAELAELIAAAIES